MAQSEDQDGQGFGADTGLAEPEKKKLNLQVKVNKPQSCVRHVVVTIPREEVDRYFRNSFDNLAPQAAVPGFRPGRAPRKLVERHFREKVDDQVKGALLMDSLGQVTEEQAFSAISEPDFDFGSISIPESGDFTYEFTVEVRPEFTTPNWQGLTLTSPVEEITEAEIDASLNRILQRYATTLATDEPAVAEDRLVLNIRTSFEGKTLASFDEMRVPLRPVLSFPDGRCEEFGAVMTGAREGETRTAKLQISQDIAQEDLRGQAIDISFEVVEVLRTELPELTNAFLTELGDFASEEELRGFVRESLTRQADYRQKEALRRQIVEKLTADADWELPQEMVRRQTRRELERKRLELRRNGFNDDYIQQILNMMRQNAQTSTEQALREHFILEQIAEDEKIEGSEADFENEIELIAEQSDMPARRVRARLEKSGQMDALRNQIIERKVIEMITEKATVTEQPSSEKAVAEENEFAISDSAIEAKDVEHIPEAKYDDSAKKEEKLPGGSNEE